MQTEMQNNGIYIGQFLLVVLSVRSKLNRNPRSGTYAPILQPCAIIATIYTMLARLGHNLGADQHLLISSRHLTRVFILSDVMTFLIQVLYNATIFRGRTDLVEWLRLQAER